MAERDAAVQARDAAVQARHTVEANAGREARTYRLYHSMMRRGLLIHGGHVARGAASAVVVRQDFANVVHRSVPDVAGRPVYVSALSAFGVLGAHLTALEGRVGTVDAQERSGAGESRRVKGRVTDLEAEVARQNRELEESETHNANGDLRTAAVRAVNLGLRTERDAARARRDELEGEVNRLTRERDEAFGNAGAVTEMRQQLREAQAAVGRLTRRLDESRRGSQRQVEAADRERQEVIPMGRRVIARMDDADQHHIVGNQLLQSALTALVGVVDSRRNAADATQAARQDIAQQAAVVCDSGRFRNRMARARRQAMLHPSGTPARRRRLRDRPLSTPNPDSGLPPVEDENSTDMDDDIPLSRYGRPSGPGDDGDGGPGTGGGGVAA